MQNYAFSLIFDPFYAEFFNLAVKILKLKNCVAITLEIWKSAACNYFSSAAECLFAPSTQSTLSFCFGTILLAGFRIAFYSLTFFTVKVIARGHYFLEAHCGVNINSSAEWTSLEIQRNVHGLFASFYTWRFACFRTHVFTFGVLCL